MSSSPTGYNTPKTNWQAADVVQPADMNRIEGNVQAIEMGSRTVDPAQAPSGITGTLRQFLDWFANRIRAILGTTNWHDAPPTTLTAAKTHIDAAAPHSGHETPTGAQAKVDAHAAGTNVHGATSAVTANRIMIRDANGRAKVAAPAAADDIARKDTVDSKFDPSTGHKHTGAAGDGPPIPAVNGLYPISGSYAGDGSGSRQITIGRRPILVYVWSRYDTVMLTDYIKADFSPGGSVHSFPYAGFGATYFTAFIGPPNTNTNGEVYNYLAFCI